MYANIEPDERRCAVFSQRVRKRRRECVCVCQIEHFLTSLESFHYALSAYYFCAVIISCETPCLHIHTHELQLPLQILNWKKKRKTVSYRTDLFFHLHHSSYVHAFYFFRASENKILCSRSFLILQTEKYLRLLCTYFSVGVICIFQCMKKNKCKILTYIANC